MTDLATLGLRIESQEVEVAEKRLNDIGPAARNAESGIDRYAEAARRADGAASTMNVALRQQQAVMTASRNSMGLTTAEGLNLSRQFADIGVTAAMGMNPLMIALQQGPQLLDIFQMAAIRAQTSVVAAMRATAAVVWTAMAPLLPVIAGIGAVVGVTAAAFGLATRSMSKEIGDVTKGMNLTEEQLKRLKDQGVSSTVTMGDYFRGLGTTIKEMFVETFGDQLSWVSRQWNSFLDLATRASFLTVQSIGTSFVGTYYAVRDTWKLLPAAMGDAAISAANAAARGINWLIQKSVDGLNALMSHYNSLPDWMRNGTTAPVLNAPQLGMLDNPYAGGLRTAGSAVGAGYGQAWDQVGGGLRDFQDRLRDNVEASAIARNRKPAGEAGSSGAGDAVRAAREARIELEGFERVNISPIILQVSELVHPLELVADEMRLLDQLAQDSARGMASAFGETGRALGDLLTTMSGYESRLAQIAAAEQRKQLSAAQADRERAHAQVQYYGDTLAAAKGFFQEGSDGYRALQAAEAAYRVFQFAMSVQAMAMGAAETSAHVAQSGTKAAASTAAGAAKMFEALGPLGFPLVAAMLALLASLGLKGKGGGGGGSASVDGSVAKSQSYSQQADASQSMFAASVAQKVEVKVTADRDGLNAYVAQTARQEAAPMVAQGMAAASGATRAQVFADLDKSRTYSRGG